MIDLMFHRHREIWLAVKCARDGGDRALWDKLSHEDNAAPPGVSGFLSHVKAKIHFLEIAMQRDRQPEQTRVEKKKADHTDERFAVFEIDFSSRWDKWRNDLWIDHEIEHGDISPVSSEKWTHADKICDGRRPPLQNQ